ncbi:MAG: hypothetical protein PF542_02820 [Nanoarchaeota archaeon]|jgi:hypothetical protein|nr:hypothetical protein [Nanoarchaeota archaeon]
MCRKCGNTFLAAIIILFSFWQLAFSKWIIVVAAAIIMINEGMVLVKYGCSACTCHTGSDFIMEKTDEELHEGPTKEEVKEVMKRKIDNN